jgi:DNA-binding FadR family transcriptional regulator
LNEHISVVNAIKRRAPEAARKAMQSHLGAALGRYHRTLARDPVVTAIEPRKVIQRRVS